ncbi:MAG: PfkB family carbohydrate kinase [Sphaerochaeta sp.]|uniref:PfkB family carbohydrate kinase n=1 Tax=Sphaerochaeta sp. TaxID=1972642 RepID=UPI0026194380|nr:PfkB family carbohydrate kinase [Sphaerochaeta sp.]MCK9598574.1 PfkB family carbohydrate kinase [Sphaerochaeta sp.]MDX9824027.1 PfkB family carbohydrate kinase [Sphaerochaeta sp.]HPE92363.1 PfkB family carbohydrate kinase [Sphaerochaeta sp.]
MKYDILMLGHISQDVLIDHQNVRQDIVGGAVVYSSFAAGSAGKRVKVITKLADNDLHILKNLQHPLVDWDVLPSKQSTSIKNTYFTADKERREVILLSQADPFVLEEVQAEASIYHLAGLFGGEIPDSLVLPLAKRGKVALDAQGVLRCLDEQKNLVFRDWGRKQELLPYITYFKTDAAEAKILTGLDDREKAARLLYSWGAQEVMLTHNTEVMVCHQGNIHTAPFTNSNNSGRTGRGDTAFAAYLAWRQDHDAAESTRFAAALCSLKMEKPGVFRGTLDEVHKRMERDRI